MKKILASIGLAVCVSGCGTITGNNSTFNVAQQEALLQASAQTATVLALTPPLGSPSYRSGFIAATNQLQNLSLTNLDISTIVSQIHGLNVGGSAVPYVELGLSDTLTILNAYGVGVNTIGGTNVTAALAALEGAKTAIANGVAQGLALTAPK